MADIGHAARMRVNIALDTEKQLGYLKWMNQLLLDIVGTTKSPTAAFLVAATAAVALDSQTKGSTRRALMTGMNASLHVVRQLDCYFP